MGHPVFEGIGPAWVMGDSEYVTKLGEGWSDAGSEVYSEVLRLAWGRSTTTKGAVVEGVSVECAEAEATTR